ncbi:hypothetical protein QOZ80_9AG0672900 [Eleusine coracana subsp. coracana]|nr:hypothetical protein QOZ80_9AG0672900 [Eleusine coracana subsp. coracana]
MARLLSGVAVLLIVVVPLCMHTIALFAGIQLGRVLERSPDSVNIISIRDVVEYFVKELWDSERRDELLVAVPATPRAVLTCIEPKDIYRRPKIDLEISESSTTTTTTPKARSYYNRNHTSPRGVISVGPWGGSGGQPFYMRGPSPPHLRSIILYHSSVIHSLACEYSRAGDGGVNRMAGPWGRPHSFGSAAVRATINLAAGEHVTAVEGTTGQFRGGSVPDVVITSLTFRTSTDRTYGPYGGGGDEEEEEGTRFSIPAASGCIVGFWGRSGWLLDAIGVYIKPCPAAGMTQG